MKNVNNLPLFSLNHIRFSPPVAYSVHWKDNTQSKCYISLVYSTGLGPLVLHSCPNTHQHFDSIVNLQEQRSFVLRCFWGQDHGKADSGLLWISTLCTSLINKYCSTNNEPRVSNDQINNLEKSCSDSNQMWFFCLFLFSLHFQMTIIYLL